MILLALALIACLGIWVWWQDREDNEQWRRRRTWKEKQTKN